jgi:hypothetical protein
MEQAQESIDAGRALAKLEALRELVPVQGD